MSRESAGISPRVAAFAVAAALGVAGCGGDDETTTTSSTTTTTATGASGATGATGAEGSSELGSIESSLEDAGYSTFPVDKPYSKGGAAQSNGATDGLYANKRTLAAEIFAFPTPEDAEAYVEDIGVESQGSPAAAVGSIGFSAAIDDSQSALDQLVEDSGAE